MFASPAVISKRAFSFTNRLAFRESDIDATTADLRERGITFLSEEPQSFGGIKTIVAIDPDGVFIQLLEWL